MASKAIFLSLQRWRSPLLEAFLAPIDLIDVALVQSLVSVASGLILRISRHSFFFKCKNSQSLIQNIKKHSTFGHFHDLNQEISTLPYAFPIKDVQLRDDVSEQIELLQKQSQRAKLFIDQKDDVLKIEFFSFLDEFENERIPDSTGLQSFFVEKLQILDTRSCRVEIESLEEHIVHHKGDIEPTIFVLNGLVALTRYSSFLLFKFEKSELELGNGNHIKKPKKRLITQEIVETFLIIPKDFYCPISLELMGDLVIISAGQTYHRSFISRWLEEGQCTCPKTRQMVVTEPHRKGSN